MTAHDTHSPADKQRENDIVKALEVLLYCGRNEKVSQLCLQNKKKGNKQQELTSCLNRGMSPCDSTRNQKDLPIQLQGRARVSRRLRGCVLQVKRGQNQTFKIFGAALNSSWEKGKWVFAKNIFQIFMLAPCPYKSHVRSFKSLCI